MISAAGTSHAVSGTTAPDPYSACTALNGFFETSDNGAGWFCTHPAALTMYEPTLVDACGVQGWSYFLETGGLNGAVSYYCPPR